MGKDSNSVLRVIEPGLGATFQDRGRAGWRRFGVPLSGWMDAHAAECANRLLDNETGWTVVELLLQGAAFEVLNPAWIAICGADVECSVPAWRACRVQAGETIRTSLCRSGLWSYLAVEGGFAAPEHFGSASYYGRGGIGARITRDTLLTRNSSSGLRLPKGVSGRLANWKDRREYNRPPHIRVWPGPQWNSFSAPDREIFFEANWMVSAQSDRVGYRLEGPKLEPNPAEIISEPVRLGSIQVPEGGQPIVTMRDGPTVGGYPKIAIVEEEDLSWVAQCRPGQSLRFQLVT